MSDDVRAAADNNARWCDAVCRSHGLATRFAADLWIAPRGSPPFYPDAVTLRPGAVTGIPGGAESVKDSFACLDLRPHGFRVLFAAHWIVHDGRPAAPPALDWRTVQSPAELDEWTAAADLGGIIRPALLAEPAIRIFAGRHSDGGPLVAGAIANASGSVAGVSNVFYEAPTVWHELPAVIAEAFPGRRIVGYERDEQLADALAAGFARLHPLRVWQRRAGA